MSIYPVGFPLGFSESTVLQSVISEGISTYWRLDLTNTHHKLWKPQLAAQKFNNSCISFNFSHNFLQYCMYNFLIKYGQSLWFWKV